MHHVVSLTPNEIRRETIPSYVSTYVSFSLPFRKNASGKIIHPPPFIKAIQEEVLFLHDGIAAYRTDAIHADARPHTMRAHSEGHPIHLLANQEQAIGEAASWDWNATLDVSFRNAII